MPPLERRTDSPGETPEVPQDPCQHWRGMLRSGTNSTQGRRPWHRRERNPERPPRNSHGDWPFLRPPEWVPEVPVESRENQPQLEKIQEVLPSRQDAAHFRRGVSRLITPNLRNFQRVFTPLLQLKKFPDIPESTREEARESRPHPEQPRFRLVVRDEGSFPCMFWKEFPAFPSHLKRRRSPQERREELQGRPTIPRVPQIHQSAGAQPRWIQAIRRMNGVELERLVYLLM